jgi:NADH-quinone oxidoreductase subunit M
MLAATANELGYPVLSLAIFLPAAASLLALVMPERDRAAAFAMGLLATGMTLALAVVLFASYDADWLAAGGASFQFADPAGEPLTWLPGGITYQVGLDGISVTLFFLTALLSLLAMLFSWSVVRYRVREYVALLLVLETGLLGVFAALDLFLFFVFWEIVLIPMFFLIGIWGGSGRIYATVKFVLFTMTGSALMLVAIIVTARLSGAETFHLFDVLAGSDLTEKAQTALFAAMVLAFAIKIPLFPLHTWLPDAHVEAPAAGSVLLAGVLLKMGAYGYLRLAWPLYPDAAAAAIPVLAALAVIGVWYGAWVAYAQDDVKSLVAYSSVSHMGVVVVGLLAMNVQGMSGGVLQMINHGLTTGALFLLVGMLYARAHTRQISSFGGLWSTMPRFSVVFLVVTLASIGLPGLNGFVGEWLSLLGAFRSNMLVGALATFGVVLCAVYMLWMYQRLFFGEPSELSLRMPDLTARELAVLAPLLGLMFWIGLAPMTFLYPIERTSQAWLVAMLSLFGGGPAGP